MLFTQVARSTIWNPASARSNRPRMARETMNVATVVSIVAHLAESSEAPRQSSTTTAPRSGMNVTIDRR